jgi:hypothetical protein
VVRSTFGLRVLARLGPEGPARLFAGMSLGRPHLANEVKNRAESGLVAVDTSIGGPESGIQHLGSTMGRFHLRIPTWAPVSAIVRGFLAPTKGRLSSRWLVKGALFGALVIAALVFVPTIDPATQGGPRLCDTCGLPFAA